MSRTTFDARLKERALLGELARLGSPVDLSVLDQDTENEKVEIEQVGGILESQLVELRDGRAAYMASIAVTNHTSRAIGLVDVELRAPWDDPLFQWITPVDIAWHSPRKQRSLYRVHKFSSDDGLELPCDQVINHDLLERKNLPGTRRLEGWLLGVGGRMPVGLRHGQMLELQLTIVAADRAEYSAPITLWTDRLSAARKKLEPRPRIFAELVEEEAADAGDANGIAPPPASPPPDVVQNLGSVGTA